MAIRKSVAILAVVVAFCTVACEAEEDPGTGEVQYLGTTVVEPG